MDVEQTLFESLRRIIRASDVHSRALMKRHNLTGPQLAVMKELAKQSQAPIGALAKTTFLGAPTVTGIVDRLLQQGWVTRVPSQDDRRQVLITITAAGRKMLKRDPPMLLETFCGKLVELPNAEQKRVCEVLQKVAGMLEQSALDGE